MSAWHPTQAVGPDGQRADVNSVSNGLKCACRCFQCGEKVVAKQGAKVGWHFAHYAPTTCSPTQESELHFFAKTVLAKHLWLWIPPAHAKAIGETKIISDRRVFSFSQVEVERADGNVRPDLILIEKGGRRLHVEIFVRHKVDSAKLAKLKSRDISSIEINLSALDWTNRSGWDLAILQTAPREWLHNSKTAQVERNLVEQVALNARRKAELVEAEFQRISQMWQAAPQCEERTIEPLSAEHELAKARGLISLIVDPVAGSRCFRVAPELWQSCILNRFLWDRLSPSPTVFETNDALGHVKHLVIPGLDRVSKDAASRMLEKHSDFRSPWHAVHEYLKLLKRGGMFDRHVGGKQWLPSRHAIDHRRDLEAAWAKDRNRRDELTQWADFLLSHIPDSERGLFDVSAWVARIAVSYEDWEERPLRQALYNMVINGEGLADDLLGLPLEAECCRQDETQTKRRIEKEQRRRIAEEAALIENRIASLRHAAEQILGSDAQAWLETNNTNLIGNTPLAAAHGSSEDAERAHGELKRLGDERARKIREELEATKQALALEKNRASLMAEASKRTRDPVRANLWCKSSQPKLGGQRPYDYCVNDHALRICFEIMPTKM